MVFLIRVKDVIKVSYIVLMEIYTKENGMGIQKLGLGLFNTTI